MKTIKQALNKKNLAKKGKDTTGVLLGLISATALAKGFDYLAEKYPDQANALLITKYSVLGGAGLVLTLVSEEESFLENFGTGLTAGTALDGIKMIPYVKDKLGINGLGEAYYTEDNAPLELGNFGLNALPVSSYQMQDAPIVNLDLPELEGLGYNETFNEMDGLGYNSSATTDTDDLGYNPAQTGDDDLSGLI